MRQSAPGRGAPGQAAIEFALVASMMVLLLVGGIDLARVFYYEVVITAAASEGARAASAGAPDNSSTAGTTTVVGVKTVAVDSAPSGTITTSNVTVTPAQATRKAEACAPSTCVWTTVTVTYTFTPVTPLMRSLVGPSFTMTRHVTQRMRQSCQFADGTACT